MKTPRNIKILKRIKNTLTPLLFLVFVLSCNQGFTQENNERIDWELQRDKMAENLDKLQDDVDNTFDEAMDVFNASDPQSEEMVEELNTELKKLGHEINVAAEKTENATEDTWDDVSKQIAESYSRIENRVKQLDEELKQ